jgi:diguanylate cyclase (GGDEF)-like protein/putative nucleotidyltransferase with HDIG domain
VASDSDAADVGVFAPPADASGTRGPGPFGGPALRAGAWGFVVLSVGLAVVLFASNGPSGSGYLAAEWVLAAVCPFVLVAVGFASYFSSGHERGLWLFLTVAVALLGLDQFSYVLAVSRMAVPAPINVTGSYVIGLLAAVPVLGFFASITRFAADGPLAMARLFVDSVAIEIAAAALLYGLVIGPWFAMFPGVRSVDAMLGAVLPVVCTTIVILAVYNLVSPSAGRLDSWQRIIGWAIAIFAGGNALWPLFFVSMEFGYGGHVFAYAFELVAFVPIAMLLVAAIYHHTTARPRGRLRPLPPPRPRRPMALVVAVPLTEIVSIPVMGVIGAGFRAGSPQQTVLLTAAAVLAGMVVARTGLTVAENGHLFSRSITDPLTGLNNHRHFQERLEGEIRSAGTFGGQVSVAMLDLDEFSRVNGLRGHAAGDVLLSAAAESVRDAVRDQDVVCRVGGDEIAVIFADTDPATAAMVCRRILDRLRSGECVDGWPVTASIGVAGYPDDAGDREDLVRKADGAQYWAKFHGKNQVVVYDPEVVLALDAEERIRNLQQQSHLATVRALAAAVDARDPLTQYHSRNVATLAVALAERVGLDRNKTQLLEVAALLHDIGKIGISDAVLRKTGKLTPSERAHIEEHPLLGEQILSSTRLTEILPWVVAHHERYDGRGYPCGLAGPAIPYEARILAICDAYDAMTSDRPYRRALSKAAAVQEIDLNMGTQFDPQLAEEFIRLVGRELRE